MRTRSLCAAIFATVIAGCVTGCAADDSDVLRGRGLSVADFSAPVQAAVYTAALHGAFDFPDPALSLLLDPRKLPRVAGAAPAGTIPADVQRELRGTGTIRGTCEPPLDSKKTPRCDARRPGYVVRFSDMFALGSDSVQVYVAVEKYDTRTSPPSQSLRFENVYQIAGRGERWRAVREGRLHAQ